jgi:hypothetical protein
VSAIFGSEQHCLQQFEIRDRADLELISLDFLDDVNPTAIDDDVAFNLGGGDRCT